MKKKLLLLFGIAICFMTIFIIATPRVEANEDEWSSCPYCDHRHGGENRCETCGGCTDSCDIDCFFDHHCDRCYDCADNERCRDIAGDCSLCMNCVQDCDWHCKECFMCYATSEESICGDCGKCGLCAGYVCEECGFCGECVERDHIHCEKCESCLSTTGECVMGYEGHCENDCIICEECGDCFFEREDQMCFECEVLCVECCKTRSEDEGCITGEVCMESPEWNDHFCENCGDDIGDNCGGKEVCEYCGLCLECCADESDCVEGVCVESPDYETHFCEDCGECFHVNERCDTCETFCRECCERMAEEYIGEAGCEDYTTTPCVSSTEFIEHMASAHSGVQHTPKYGNEWTTDSSSHWKRCVYCGSEETKHNKDMVAHNYETIDSVKKCKVCGFIEGAKIYITKQPRDYSAKVSSYRQTNIATYTVAARAKDGGTLTYQWYMKDGSYTSKLDGETASTLRYTIPTDCCPGTGNYDDISFYCVITSLSGDTTQTNDAKLKISHSYYDDEEMFYDSVNTSEVHKYFPNNSDFLSTITITTSKGHNWKCVGDNCEQVKNTRYTPHNFTTKVKVGTLAQNTDNVTGNVYKRECKDCGYVEYSYSHVHKYYFEDGTPNCNVSSYVFENGTATTEDLVKESGYTRHPLKCIQENCYEYKMVPHRWAAWQITGYPSKTSTAGMARECLDCSYTENCFKDNEGNDYQWTINNALVETQYVLADKFLIEPGDKIEFTLNLKTGEALIGWKIETIIRQNGESKDVTGKFTIRKNGDKYETIVPSWSTLGRSNGGIIVFFTAITGPCQDHSEKELINKKDQICLREGYTGDLACVKCGYVAPGDNGTVIPVPEDAEHESLTLIPGTAIKNPNCTTRAYDGDYKCGTCGAIVSGKKGEKGKHYYPLEMINVKEATCYEEGWKGDFMCLVCHKIVKSYGAAPVLHKQEGNYKIVAKKDATCTTAGYTGDKVCAVPGGCGQTYEYGVVIPAIGHNWSDWTVTDEATATVAGKRNRTCTACGAYEEKSYLLNEFTITFNPGDGGFVNPTTATTAKTKKLTSLPVPTRDGYVFSHWVMGPEEDTNRVTLNTVFTENTEVRAEYEAERLYRVTFYANVPDDDAAGGIGSSIRYTNREGKLRSSDVPNYKLSPGRKYKFIGWFDESNNEIAVNHTFTRNSSLYGKWEAVSNNEFEITFKSTDPAYSISDVTYNKKITLFPEWDKPGYVLAGWYMLDGGKQVEVTKNTKFTKNSTVYAIWELDGYKITFSANGGTVALEEAYASKTTGKLELTELPIPTYAGYDFEGWFMDEEEITLVTTFTKDTNVYAKWTYVGGAKITFNPNGGTVAVAFARTNEKTKKLTISLPVPIRTGYDFAGWFTEDGTRITSKSVFNEDTELFAKWIYSAGYIITFNANGGTVGIASEMTNEEGKLLNLPTPTRTKYKFAGWYDAQEGGNKIDVNKVYTEDTEIYAHWTEKSTAGSGTGSSSNVTYKITTKVDENATITPSGVVKVEKGNDQTFRIKVKSGYEIKDVLIDGKSIGVVSAYTFEKVNKKHTIEVKTKQKAEEIDKPVGPKATYSDVSATSWYNAAVDFVTEKELMNGTGDNKFSPDAYMTRAMIVTVLYRLDATGEVIESSFTDVAVNSYYAKAVAWAEKNGIVNGYGDGIFGPNDIITREQLATILYRYANYKKYDVKAGNNSNVNKFDDSETISEYAITAFNWACGEGLIKGETGNLLNPKGNATRAQVATILMRFCEKLSK